MSFRVRCGLCGAVYDAGTGHKCAPARKAAPGKPAEATAKATLHIQAKAPPIIKPSPPVAKAYPHAYPHEKKGQAARNSRWRAKHPERHRANHAAYMRLWRKRLKAKAGQAPAIHTQQRSA